MNVGYKAIFKYRRECDAASKKTSMSGYLLWTGSGEPEAHAEINAHLVGRWQTQPLFEKNLRRHQERTPKAADRVDIDYTKL